MSEENLWMPTESEWYSAVLKESHPKKGYIVAELQNGECVWIREMVITFGGPGKHYYCLPTDGTTEMSVRIERQNHSTLPYKAIEAQIAADTNAPECREDVTVERWTYKCGGVRRACGCGLFAWFQSRHSGAAFQEGDTIQVDVSFSQRRGDFIGTVVEEEF